MSIIHNILIREYKKIPRWGWLYGLIMSAAQGICYWGGHYLSVATGTIDNAWCPSIPAIDGKIPFVPVFIIIYVYSYVFWYCGHVAVTITGKKNVINYTIGLCTAYLIGLVIYATAPSCMNRLDMSNVTTIGNTRFLNWLTQLIYSCDGGDTGYNLFPSFHCLTSLYAFSGIRKQKSVSLLFRIYTLLMAILIFLSTILVHQHYVLDVLGGITLGFICFGITKWLDPAEKILKKRSKL